MSKKNTKKKKTAKSKRKKTVKDKDKETTEKKKTPKKKTGLLYDMDVRELLVLFIAANFLVDGIIMIILITQLYL